MEMNNSGSSSPYIGAEDQKGKRVLTVGYIVTQTLRMLAQLIVNARVPSNNNEENDTTSQWLNLKYSYSRLVDEDLQSIISPLSKSSEHTPQGLVIEIWASFSSDQQKQDLMLERWTLKFVNSTNTGPNLPTTINDKLSIVLIRSVVSFLRILPAHTLARRCKKQVMPFTLRYSFSSPSVVNRPTPTLASSPFTRTPQRAEKGLGNRCGTYSFGSIVSETGTLSASVEYETDLSMFEGSFTIDPYVITDYAPMRTTPIAIAPTVHKPLTAQSAPTRMGFYGTSPRSSADIKDGTEKEVPQSIPARRSEAEQMPLYTPQPKKPAFELFHMSPSPPDPYLLGYISSSAPSSSTPLDDRPASPFIISNDTSLSPSPTEGMEPEINSFYVKDKYGRRTLSISPSSSPPPQLKMKTPPSSPGARKGKQKEDIFFSAQLPPKEMEGEELQFGGEFEEDFGSSDDLDKFVHMCTHPSELKMFKNKQTDWADDLKELRQFLSNVSS